MHNIHLLTGMCSGQQQFFRVTPTDVHVGEGRTAVINCAVENRAGRVQWTKDGLTLGKKKRFLFNPMFHVVTSYV